MPMDNQRVYSYPLELGTSVIWVVFYLKLHFYEKKIIYSAKAYPSFLPYIFKYPRRKLLDARSRSSGASGRDGNPYAGCCCDFRFWFKLYVVYSSI